MAVVEKVIEMAKFLLRCPAGVPLLKQLFDHILFNPRLWINSEPDVQARVLFMFTPFYVILYELDLIARGRSSRDLPIFSTLPFGVNKIFISNFDIIQKSPFLKIKSTPSSQFIKWLKIGK